ncbi:MAG: TonB-dependent receptor, partial [Pedobacter sp.]|nr:TonB-dependent receptor [Chitinophagaceae bacterium]
IELITNPSAKYEAAGNAGIINIRLKKNKSLGTNGSLNAGYAIGVYGKYNGGLLLNRRNSKVNIFGNYNFNHAKNVADFRLNRNVGDSFFNLVSKRLQTSNTHGFKAGIDFFINKKSTLGFLVNGTIADNLPDNFSKTTIGYTPFNTINRLLIADNKNHTIQNNINFNSNYHYADANGHDLNIDADYGLFRNTNNQNQPNYYYNAAGTTELSHAIYSFIAPTNIDIYSLKVDYEQNFKKGKLGIGGKASYVKTNNHFDRYDVANTGNTLDVFRSNQFNYTENVNALYLNYNRKYETMVLQFGVRAEHTVSDGQSYQLNANGSVNYAVVKPFKRSYLDFFPSAAITFNKNPQNQWSIAYGRRIDRPNYQFLNPFEFKLDEYNYRKGNPNLQPQYTNSISITNLYKTKLVTKLSYSYVKDVFAQITDTIDINKSFITNKNLATQNIISLGISYPFQYKWYTGFVAINSFYSNYKADFGGGDRVINLDVFAYTCNLQNSFKLGNGFIAEVNGFYNSPTIWQGTFTSKAQGGVDAGMQKNIWQGKATIKASVTDIFLTQAFNAENNFAGQKSNVFIQNENRQFKINFTYRFGSNQVKAARNRSTGAEEESKRSQGGGQ